MTLGARPDRRFWLFRRFTAALFILWLSCSLALTASAGAAQDGKQEALRLARTIPDAGARATAVSSLTDQEVLAAVLRLDAEMQVRLAAAARIADQTVLAQACRNESGLSGKHHPSAAEKLGLVDSWLLNDFKRVHVLPERLEFLAVDEIFRAAALKYVHAQDLLADIALRADSKLVRAAAILKLADQVVLADIAKKDKDPRLRRCAILVLTDQPALAEIARAPRRLSADCLKETAVRRLQDQKLIEEFARSGPEYLRLLALEKLEGQELLYQLAREDKNKKIRRAAAGLITDEVLYEKLVAEGRPELLPTIEGVGFSYQGHSESTSVAVDGKEVYRKMTLQPGPHSVVIRHASTTDHYAWTGATQGERITTVAAPVTETIIARLGQDYAPLWYYEGNRIVRHVVPRKPFSKCLDWY